VSYDGVGSLAMVEKKEGELPTTGKSKKINEEKKEIQNSLWELKLTN